MGSGVSAEAAIRLERHFIGCDIIPEYVEFARSRIERTKIEMFQLPLPEIPRVS
jgi:DNA modification methylase